MEKILFSQLWAEEEDYLIHSAGKLGDGNVIVEIGTAQGGSSFLFGKGTQGKGVHIYSYDITPSKEAFENLKGTNVKIISQSSIEGAKSWPYTCGQPIDLLFIDGSHTLSNVINDFTYWVPLLNKKAEVILHDYDPPEKGGYPHLGVKIAVDTFIREEIFDNYVHVGRLMGGHVKDIQKASVIPEEAYWTTWKNMGSIIMDILEKKWKECTTLGQGSNTLKLLLEILGIKEGPCSDHFPWDSVQNQSLLLFERPTSEKSKTLLTQHKGNILLLTDLIIYYLLYWAMAYFEDEVLTCVRNRNTYFKFKEQLEMLNHFCGTQTIEDIFDPSKPKNIFELSAIVGREIIRTAFLSEIRNSID